MLTPINIYANKIGRHIMTSEIYAAQSRQNLKLKRVQIITNSLYECSDFLYIYLLIKSKARKKKFYLSPSQKKYQTTFVKTKIIKADLSIKSFYKFMLTMSNKLIPEFLNHLQENLITFNKSCIIIKVQNLPMLIPNHMSLFKSQYLSDVEFINFNICISLNTNEFQKYIFYIKYFKFVEMQ